ncbi:MAG: MBOAT family O-acyltransferase, partial [Acetivibrio ethanolgignens]
TAANINSLTEFFVKKEIIPPFQLILPIGISFYTFQIASYLIDVYREKIRAEKSVITLGAYLCMFPQLIAGPIVTYSSVAAQLRNRKHTLKKLDDGLRLFTLGLGLKVLLANQIGRLWTDIGAVGYESISTPLAWMGIFAYSLQLYFDFYGYSLMAIGLGKLLGMNLPQNFNYPYMAVSMTDFWRRWHITLGSWFREYIYIPLGGNRQGNLKTIKNLFIVWTFTGIWHGASWNFVLWGILLFVIITLEKYIYGNILQKVPVLGHAYMLFLIPVSWSLFEITDFNQLGIYLGKLFPILGKQQTPLFAGDYIKYGKMYGIFLILGFIFSTNLPRKLYERWKNKMIASIVLLAIFWASVYCLYMGMDDPFLYFRF